MERKRSASENKLELARTYLELARTELKWLRERLILTYLSFGPRVKVPEEMFMVKE